jgi:hypothetical protein
MIRTKSHIRISLSNEKFHEGFSIGEMANYLTLKE